ncbi:MAG: family 10 glycosylhydrolase [Leptolyngbya sp. SIO4C5]|nr:family 10 glycosylhydrolase [Leptolyngbya sp. SIO4C5]
MGRRSQRLWALSLSFIFTFTLVLGIHRSLPAVAQTPLEDLLTPPVVYPTDTANHWADQCIQVLAKSERLSPDAYPAGRFRPNDSITWSELVSWLTAAPVPSPAPTAADTALGLDDPANFLSHYPNQYFDLSRPLSRAEVITAIAAYRDYPYISNANATLVANFEDSAAIPDFAREAIAAALEQQGLVIYPTSRRLQPNQLVSRGEAAALLCQTSKLPGLLSTLPPDTVIARQLATDRPAPSQEIRGVWLTNIDSDVLFSRDRLSEAITTLAELNFNTIYPTIWNWGDTLYPSAIAERFIGQKQGLYPLSEEPAEDARLEATQRDRDMLQEAVELGHAAGLKVIPWFEFGFMAPADSELVRRHPDWITQRADGTQIKQEGNDARVWLNPFHPEVQRFMLLLVDEVMRRYPVDGFQVDDHMGLPVEFGYDPVTVTLYQQEHGGKKPPESAQDAAWVRWRASKIADFMAEVAQVVRMRRPGAIVSVSPNPYPFSYANYLQDWPTWVEQGSVDELIIQLYRDNLNRFVWEMNKATAQASRRRIPTAVGILTGLKGRPTAMDLIDTQIKAVRDRQYAGISFFFYETVLNMNREAPQERQAALSGLFPNQALRP